jgi:predicted deacylase
MALACALNLPYIHTPGRAKAGFLIDACQQAGIRAVLIEVGGGRSLDTQYHQAVLNGLVNLMQTVELLEGDPAPGPEPYIFRRKDIISAPCAGLFQPAVQLEQRVQEGDCLGVIVPLLDENGVEVLSPRDGIMLYLRREPVVGEQDSLVHII